MQSVKVKFIERIQRTPTVASFRFASLDGGRFDFLPGQFFRVIFDESSKNNIGLNKYLSFSCAPGKDYFELTKRLSDSEFSARLDGLRVGQEVTFQMPMGSCVFKEEYERIVFLIGGIGITPAISIIEYIMEKKLNTKVSLLYANRSEDDIAFKKELDGWRVVNSNIDICYLVGKKTCSDSDCREGRIDDVFCHDSIKDITKGKVFIYGPPQMVDAMRKLAEKMGCSKEDILSENFIGY